MTTLQSLFLEIPQKEIAAFCRRHHINRLAFFGSVLREELRPDSDVDVLVEFEPDHIPGLAFFAIEDELSQIMARKVDLNTLQFLSPYFRQQVRDEAVVIYPAYSRLRLCRF